MKTITTIFILAAFFLMGCKSGEGTDIRMPAPLERSSTKTQDKQIARSSYNWEGTYEGVTPCADCEGIETTLTLKTDETFDLSQTYLGVDGRDESRFHESGRFNWEENGNEIIVRTSDQTIRFKVGNNEVTMLDMAGNVVSGELANFYVLKKK